jgi:predicted AAA+ superfamily ATPase
MKNELNDDYSSKMKRVFIELHNYSFSHGSSEIGNSDERFIGRKRLLEKFKSVFTNTDKNSGIYLVTGYRGMGKTSFVNKAIEEIYSPKLLIKNIIRWGVLLTISFFLVLFLVFL